MQKLLIGLDIGGTKIEAALISQKDKKVLERKRLPTERQKGYNHVLNIIVELISPLMNDQVRGIGIGLPGSVHPKNHQMLTGNTALFVGKNLEKDLRQKLFRENQDFKIAFNNDANCFALAETYLGAGLEYCKQTGISPKNQNMIGVILGTGCGTGIILNGKIYEGKNGGAGEAGHTPLVTNGAPCYCGRSGCAEQYLSGPGLEALFFNRMYSQIAKAPSAKEIFELYENEDPIAIAVVLQYKKYLSQFIGNLNNILDVDYFVLGGGLSQANCIYKELEELSSAHSFIPQLKPRILHPALLESAGCVGAALLLEE